jgi:hypothetical protein
MLSKLFIKLKLILLKKKKKKKKKIIFLKHFSIKEIIRK